MDRTIEAAGAVVVVVAAAAAAAAGGLMQIGPMHHTAGAGWLQVPEVGVELMLEDWIASPVKSIHLDERFDYVS